MSIPSRLNDPMTRATLLKRSMGVAALGATGSLLAACGASDDGTSASASVSANQPIGGELRYVGWDGEDGAAAMAKFIKRNNITVSATGVASGDELLTKLRSEGGNIDLVTQNKDYAAIAMELGLLTALDLALLPNYDDIYDSFHDAPWTSHDGETFVIPLIWGEEPIVYDPRKWDGVPARYTDLAESRFKGELTTLDDPYSNLWLFSKSLGHPDPARITQEQLDQTLDAALTVKPNIVSLAASFGDLTDLLVRGDASMAFNGWAAMTVFAAEKGVELKHAVPAVDGTYFWSDGYSIPVGAPNPRTAYAYIDRIISPTANAALAESLFSGAVSPQAAKLLPASIRNLYDYSLVETVRDGVGPRGGGILPPLKDDGEIVGVAKWKEAWQKFKIA